jgi:hypothetical protein
MLEPVTPATTAQATAHLTELKQHLEKYRLHARLLTPGQRLPCLRIINLEAPTLSEIVSAAPLESQWWFWWSWAEKITPADQTGPTADRIRRVLAHTAQPAPEPPPRKRPAHAQPAPPVAVNAHRTPFRTAPPDRLH